MKRNFGCITRYFVELFYSRTSKDVMLTSDEYLCEHDAKEFVNWIAHQYLGFIPYRIVEVTYIDKERILNPFPRMEMRSRAKFCNHFPPMPLTLAIKKKRRKEREHLGLFYSYN